ncbi:MAG: hypothetical protein GTO03_02475 [Planctomycetales bacterium]|nr:hypothetical protein [Planctomycetales bacterium]
MLSSDLLIASQAAAAATAAGAEFAHAPSAAAVQQQLDQHPADLIAIDLASCEKSLEQLVPQLRQLAPAALQIVAFGPHVHHARLAAARAAGCDQVLTRGQFHAEMQQLFAGGG